MPLCQAFGCNNRTGRVRKYMFQFPRPTKNPELFKGWASAVSVEKFLKKAYEWRKDDVICEDHFTSDCFAEDIRAKVMGYEPTKKTLKPDAVPSIFLQRPLPTATAPRRASLERQKSSEICEILSGPSQPTATATSESHGDSTALSSSIDADTSEPPNVGMPCSSSDDQRSGKQRKRHKKGDSAKVKKSRMELVDSATQTDDVQARSSEPQTEHLSSDFACQFPPEVTHAHALDHAYCLSSVRETLPTGVIDDLSGSGELAEDDHPDRQVGVGQNAAVQGSEKSQGYVTAGVVAAPDVAEARRVAGDVGMTEIDVAMFRMAEAPAAEVEMIEADEAGVETAAGEDDQGKSDPMYEPSDSGSSSDLLKYSPKRLHFKYPAMQARVQLAILDNNHNYDTKQAVVQRATARSAEKGSLRFSRAYSKATKLWMMKPIMEGKDYQYMWDLMVDVLLFKQGLATFEPAPIPELPSNVARVPYPAREELLEGRKTRFSREGEEGVPTE